MERWQRLTSSDATQRIPAREDYDRIIFQTGRAAISHAEYLGHPGQQLFYSPPGAGMALSGNQLSDAKRFPQVPARGAGIRCPGAARPDVNAGTHGTCGTGEGYDARNRAGTVAVEFEGRILLLGSLGRR